MKSLNIILLGIYICAPGTAQNQADSLIYPKPAEKILILEAVESEAEMLSGQRIIEGPLQEGILLELNEPFHQSLIKLSQCSRNLAGNTNGPNVLLLSTNEGGFARHGLTLIAEDQSNDFPDLNYVDLVVSEEGLNRGALDIFSHELGHAMMHNLWENLGEGANNFMSPKMHVSMGVTDFITALNEGFGIHFQRLTNEQIGLYQTLSEEKFKKNDNTAALWHSSVDEALRLNGVLDNRYIHQKLLPRGVDISALSTEERILLYHTSPLFDPTRLKNAQQMLSCEGVVAALFYKMNTNSILQNNYLDKDFYNAFLLYPMPSDLDPATIFTPYENVMLKHFWVWYQLNRADMTGKTVLVEYMNAWVIEFPEDREELTTLFISMTAGKTVNNVLGELYEKLACQGLMGDYFGYMETRTSYQQAMDKTIGQVLNGEIAIDANVGPELWIENTEFQIRYALWMPEPKNNLRVNINTADRFELSSFENISSEQAEKIITEREKLGYFNAINQVKEFSGYSQ